MVYFKGIAIGAAVVALATHTSAQVARYCSTADVCYQLNIPATTASSGNGDIFFQLSAPSSYDWVALGQGTRMAGSQIFVVYTAGNGNVTLSPRLGTGYSMPMYNSNAQVTLLEGSGVSDGRMIANVRCSSCNSWSGSTTSFSEGSGDWILAYQASGGPMDSTDMSARIMKHSDSEVFQWDYANAKGGSSVNPFVTSTTSGTSPSGTSAPLATSSAIAGATSGEGGGDGSKMRMVIAHGTLAGLAFAFFFPIGGILIRLSSFKGTMWIHAGMQAFAYAMFIAAFGIGVYVARMGGYLSTAHAIIGIVLFAVLFFQPIGGILHHLSFRKHQKRSLWSYAHVWIGRLAITLGIINGGLGLQLAGETGAAPIAYGVIAGVIWAVWVASAVFGELRRSKAGNSQSLEKREESSSSPEGTLRRSDAS